MTPRLPVLLPLLALLAACATEGDDGLDQPLPEEVQAAWAAVQPEGLLDLVEDPGRAIPQGLTCPSIDWVDGVETWTGDCAMVDGTVIEGSLVRHVSDEGSWVVGDQLAVYQDGLLTLFLDGAVELAQDGELLLLDAAATTCGVQGDCVDGLITVDLRLTLLPDDDDLASYDAIVRGFVAREDADPATVEGAWHTNALDCELEPVDGLFAVGLDQRHTLVLDGQESCDACAERTVQGVPATAWCAGSLR